MPLGGEPHTRLCPQLTIDIRALERDDLARHQLEALKLLEGPHANPTTQVLPSSQRHQPTLGFDVLHIVSKHVHRLVVQAREPVWKALQLLRRDYKGRCLLLIPN